MLITVEELAKFSGVHKNDDPVSVSLLEIYIGSATSMIKSYLGYSPEDTENIPESVDDNARKMFKFVCLEIASLMQMEEKNNIGVNSKSFGESGTRSFLNVVDYDKYLRRLNAYRIVTNG